MPFCSQNNGLDVLGILCACVDVYRNQIETTVEKERFMWPRQVINFASATRVSLDSPHYLCNMHISS